MSGYAPRRMPSSAGAAARQGSSAPSKGSSGRNNAARDAQRRLQQMMIGQVDDEYDYDGRDSYQEPVIKPIQVTLASISANFFSFFRTDFQFQHPIRDI